MDALVKQDRLYAWNKLSTGGLIIYPKDAKMIKIKGFKLANVPFNQALTELGNKVLAPNNIGLILSNQLLDYQDNTISLNLEDTDLYTCLSVMDHKWS
jgi:hypothetical protein